MPTSFAESHNSNPQRHGRLQGRSFAHSIHQLNIDSGDSRPKLEEEIRRCLCRALGETTKDIVLVVGVSGGCDSVGLFHGLLRVLVPTTESDGDFSLECRGRYFRVSVHAAHFDHQLRGAESDGDRRFVEELCRSYEVPYHCFFWNTDHSSDDSTSFSQDAARVWRRSRMGALVRQLVGSHDQRLGVILTAHHADDSMESLLLKLVRGTHITNIKGMDSVTEDSIGNRIIRPLLRVHKQDIADYLQEHNLSWREDSSNASNKYLRNKVRNELIPLLTEMVGGHEILLHKRLDNLSRQSSEVRQDLQTRATRYLQETNSDNSFLLPASRFELVHKEALYSWVCLKTSCHQFGYEQLERVVHQLVDFPENYEWTLNIGHGWNVVREGGVLHVVSDNAEPPSEPNLNDKEDVKVSWNVVSPDNRPDETIPGIEFCISSNLLEEMDGLYLSTLRTTNLPFTPPWRKGRSPTKAAQFLRGQQVALHHRREARILYVLYKNGSRTSAAIEIPAKGEWVLDASMACDDSPKTGMKRIFVTLPKCLEKKKE